MCGGQGGWLTCWLEQCGSAQWGPPPPMSTALAPTWSSPSPSLEPMPTLVSKCRVSLFDVLLCSAVLFWLGVDYSGCWGTETASKKQLLGYREAADVCLTALFSFTYSAGIKEGLLALIYCRVL